MPFPVNQVMKHFHVFISLLMAFWLAAVCVMASNQPIRIITLACQVPSFQQHNGVSQQLNFK